LCRSKRQQPTHPKHIFQTSPQKVPCGAPLRQHGATITAVQDELTTFTSMTETSFQPGAKHAWSFATSRWNSRKPLVFNLAENYPAWLLLCKSNGGQQWRTYLAPCACYLRCTVAVCPFSGILLRA
jgi:hypothetical protein